MNALKRIGIVVAFAAAVLTGCKKDNPSQAVAGVVAVEMPNGESVEVEESQITPSLTTYEGEGIAYSRQVDHLRIMSPLGVSPGETISRQQPAQIQTGPAPAVSISPSGVNAEATDQATSFKGGAGQWGAVSSLWQRIKDFTFGTFGFVAVGLLVLFLFFPAAVPVVFGWLKVALVWIWDRLKTVFTLGYSAIVKQQAKQVAQGDTAFVDSVNARVDLSPDQKKAIIDAFNASYTQ
ncbi:MAG: hypothetical protein BIFFINMI_02384 [Phycisphaerae bacterium]|nr:hypothetical protein [Phycisphaerae bacterium]